MRLPGRFPAATSLAAGLVMPLAFSPFDLFFIAPLALAWLFLVWLQVPLRRRVAAAFAFGLGIFGAGVSWVYVSLHDFGNMPPLLAAVCVAGFVALLALYPAIAALATGLFDRAGNAVRLLVVFPGLWAGVEIARNHLFTGFSWLEIGYSQVPSPLGNFGALAGVHGVSLLTAVSAALVAALVVGLGARWRPLLLLVVVVAAGYLLSWIEWTRPDGAPVSAALVQGNVPLSTKWNFEAANRVARRYLELSREADDVDVIIWPESPLPFFIDQMGARFYDEVVSLPAPLLSGFLERVPVGERGFDYHNSAILFDADTRVYRKRHLVPFGEYTPLPWLFEPVIGYFEVPMSVLSPWTGPQEPMPVAGRRAAVSICYEDAFPGDIRPFARDAEFLVNITEDAWFGDSLAPWQRLQMARMRSIETARPMLRASNTGLAAAIDHRGRVIALSPMFTEHVMTGTVQPRTGDTPYLVFGDVPVWIVIALALGVGLVVARRHHGGDAA